MKSTTCPFAHFPQVDDIIQSAWFAHGAYTKATHEGPCGRIEPGSTTVTRTARLSIEERLEAAARTGDKNQPEILSVNVRADDPTRGTAKFIVKDAHLVPGGCYDFVYDRPDRWYILAQQLDENGDVDPQGEELEFQLETFTEDIQILGKAGAKTTQAG